MLCLSWDITKLERDYVYFLFILLTIMGNKFKL